MKAIWNFQLTIPAPLRERIGLRIDDVLEAPYDEVEGVIKLAPVGRRRTTLRLGRSITPDEIKAAAEEALDESTS